MTYQASDNIPMLRAFSADPLVLKASRADAVSGLVDLMSAALRRRAPVRHPVIDPLWRA
ncbi:MAG: hypothetical protein WDO24_23270 [Pseudomonadota bacterium]